MSTITKQAVQAVADLKVGYTLGHADVAILNELARIALASLEAVPVGEVSEQRDGLVMDGMVDLGGASTHRIIKGASKMKRLPLGTKFYTAPPAPVSVPDEVCWEDVPEEITEDDMALASAWAHGFNQCRAAMLKHSEPFIVTSDHRMMEMPQVEAINAVTAMIQGVVYAETPTTMQTAPALDSSPKIAELPSGNSPVIPDGWVACVERMPEDDDFVYIWPRPDFGVELHVGQYCECHPKGDGWYAQVYEQNYGIEWCSITVTHWMPLPAAPQQEVTQVLAKGMERYGDAMQKLADSGD